MNDEHHRKRSGCFVYSGALALLFAGWLLARILAAGPVALGS